jgi:hypothetical protein
MHLDPSGLAGASGSQPVAPENVLKTLRKIFGIMECTHQTVQRKLFLHPDHEDDQTPLAEVASTFVNGFGWSQLSTAAIRVAFELAERLGICKVVPAAESLEFNFTANRPYDGGVAGQENALRERNGAGDDVPAKRQKKGGKQQPQLSFTSPKGSLRMVKTIPTNQAQFAKLNTALHSVGWKDTMHTFIPRNAPFRMGQLGSGS